MLISRPWARGGTDLENPVQQNLARQYAAGFGKRGTKDPSSHHLIQDTESVSVTATVDPPRGDGTDHSGDNTSPEVAPRGFFADQFEVSFSFFLLMTRPRETSWVVRGAVYVLRPATVWNVLMTL